MDKYDVCWSSTLLDRSHDGDFPFSWNLVQVYTFLEEQNDWFMENLTRFK